MEECDEEVLYGDGIGIHKHLNIACFLYATHYSARSFLLAQTATKNGNQIKYKASKPLYLALLLAELLVSVYW